MTILLACFALVVLAFVFSSHGDKDEGLRPLDPHQGLVPGPNSNWAHGHAPAVHVLLLLALTWAPQAHAQGPSTKAAEQAARRAAPGNLVGHGGPVKAIQVSADGTRALTGSFDYSAILWDITVEPPKILLRLTDHNAAVNAVAFVGKDRALTAGDDSLVRLWDLATGKLVRKFEGHDAGSKIVGLAISSDGKLAASAGWDRTARLWDLAALRSGPVLREHTKPVNAVAFSDDGASLLTASADGTVGLTRTADGAFVRPLLQHGWGINVLHAFGESSRFVAGALDGAVLVAGTNDQSVKALPSHGRPVLSVAVTPDGLIATAGGDGVVRVSKMDEGLTVEEYKHSFGPVWALALVPRTADKPQRLYYAGLDDFVTLWQVAPRKPFEEVDASQYPRRFQMTGKSGDDQIAKGELQFARKCSICHTLTPDGANRAGPSLHSIFGRKIATFAGYNYSPELKTLDIVWNAETIAKLFELGPDKFTPGSKMPLQVMSDKAERDALVAFLERATR